MIHCSDRFPYVLRSLQGLPINEQHAPYTALSTAFIRSLRSYKRLLTVHAAFIWLVFRHVTSFQLYQSVPDCHYRVSIIGTVFCVCSSMNLCLVAPWRQGAMLFRIIVRIWERGNNKRDLTQMKERRNYCPLLCDELLRSLERVKWHFKRHPILFFFFQIQSFSFCKTY